MLKLPDKVVYNDVDMKQKTGAKRHLLLTYAIALWYNGVPFVNDGDIYHIGCSPPPKLRTLIGCSEKHWKNIFEPTLERLQEKGQLKEQTILRRNVRWVPDLDFRKTIGEIFHPYMTDLVLHGPINDDVGLVGDWNESLAHRMGVERLRAIQERRGCHTEVYPTVGNKTTPDIYWYEDPTYYGPLDKPRVHYKKFGGEMLTDHNNNQMPKEKYRAFASDPETDYVWVFEDRRHAAKTLTLLDKAGDLDCTLVNAPYNNPENYSLKTLNEYVTRSQNAPKYSCYGIDRVTTLTALQDQISQPHGNLQHKHHPPGKTPVAVN